ncbi:CatB-related O-acetyltransferase [Mucilaginibacter sp.]|uniref:CatB-related O-acetyltransferase n=1 Tax=Mucilaginibacter sp. TaxID=1882438 RepID=UPI0035BC625F
MKDWLKRNYYRWGYRTKKVAIGPGVVLDTRNDFKGQNVIGADTIVGSSEVGIATYIADKSYISKTLIGKFCSIGSHVQTGLGVHPSGGFASTHPAFYSTQRQAGFSFVKNNLFNDHVYIDEQQKYVVKIGNDVWIGNNVLIMDGVTIGDGAIVASGAVVNQDVAPYEIVGGVPAKHIRYRFEEQQIQQLSALKWWDWSFEKLKANAPLFKDVAALTSANL